jgi:predicted amidohydrolase YtcJ
VTGLLLRNAEIAGRRLVDVRLAGGRVVEVGVGLAQGRREDLLDAMGAAVLPGLCDHHLHLFALAAAQNSVACGPPAVRSPADLASALATAPADLAGWVRGIGYVETVAGDLDATALDRLHPGRPVRIQHRSGALWIVNGLAATALGLPGGDHPGIERSADGSPTGRLWRADDWLRTRLPLPGVPDLSTVGARLAGLGITAVTDATPDLDDDALTALAVAVRSGALPQRVQLLGAPLDQRDPLPGLTTGPYKIVLADSGLPDLDSLVERIRAAHAASRAVAVHCVSREALVLLVTAFAVTGVRAGDRIEHASLVPAELLPSVAGTGLRVVTQPGFLADRGDDYLRDVPADDIQDLYRWRSLLDAGVRVAPSSDAPYGPLDPWAVMAAAALRRTPAGAVIGPAERVPVGTALAGYLSRPEFPGGRPRRLAAGCPADLVVLDRPLAGAEAAPTADAVRAVVIAGRIVSER